MIYQSRKNANAIAEMGNLSQKRQMGKLDQLLSLFPFIFKNTKPTISVLRLEGVIGKVSSYRSGLTIDSLNPLIEKAFNNPRVTAVCLCVNSPGGSPVQSELISNRIIALSKEKDIPVFSFVEDIAGSGGYWLACSGREIYASKTSIIGSIGVISAGFGFQEAIAKLGIERRVYTQGNNKSVLDPFLPEKSSDVKIIKKLQKEAYEHFVNTIKERRAGKLTQEDEILFNGEIWAGQTAQDYGLIDGISDLYSFIKHKFGDEVKIDYITPKESWLKKKLGMSVRKISDDLVGSLVFELENKITYDKFNIR